MWVSATTASRGHVVGIGGGAARLSRTWRRSTGRLPCCCACATRASGWPGRSGEPSAVNRSRAGRHQHQRADSDRAPPSRRAVGRGRGRAPRRRRQPARHLDPRGLGLGRGDGDETLVAPDLLELILVSRDVARLARIARDTPAATGPRAQRRSSGQSARSSGRVHFPSSIEETMRLTVIGAQLSGARCGNQATFAPAPHTGVVRRSMRRIKCGKPPFRH